MDYLNNLCFPYKFQFRAHGLRFEGQATADAVVGSLVVISGLTGEVLGEFCKLDNHTYELVAEYWSDWQSLLAEYGLSL